MIIISAIKMQDGTIFSGKRHNDCIKEIIAFGKYNSPVTKNTVQGFLTDKGEFLNREEALIHFLTAGQISVNKNRIHSKLLFSEDLY